MATPMKLHVSENYDFTKINNVVSVVHEREGNIVSSQKKSNAITSIYPYVMLGMAGATQESPSMSTARMYLTDSATPVSKLTLLPADFGYDKYISLLWQSGSSTDIVNIAGTDFLEFTINKTFFESITEAFTVRSILNRYGTTSNDMPDYGGFFCGTVLDTPIDIKPGDTVRVTYKMRVPCGPTIESCTDVSVGTGQFTVSNKDIDGNTVPGETIDWECLRTYVELRYETWPPYNLTGPCRTSSSADWVFKVDNTNVAGVQITSNKLVSDVTIDSPSYSMTISGAATLTRSGESGSRLVQGFNPLLQSTLDSYRRLSFVFTPALEVPYTHFLRVEFQYTVTWTV